MDYKELLKDERWVKIRKFVIDRDEICQFCGRKKYLQVHHLIYIKGRKPWEYHPDLLITLCAVCHSVETANSFLINDYIAFMKISGLNSLEIIKLFFDNTIKIDNENFINFHKTCNKIRKL